MELVRSSCSVSFAVSLVVTLDFNHSSTRVAAFPLTATVTHSICSTFCCNISIHLPSLITPSHHPPSTLPPTPLHPPPSLHPSPPPPSLPLSPPSLHPPSTLPDRTLPAAVRLWSLQLYTTLVVFKAHIYPVWSVDFSPTGFYFASGSHDRTACVWSTEQAHPVRVLAGHTADVDVSRLTPFMLHNTVISEYLVLIGHCTLQSLT